METYLYSVYQVDLQQFLQAIGVDGGPHPEGDLPDDGDQHYAESGHDIASRFLEDAAASQYTDECHDDRQAEYDIQTHFVAKLLLGKRYQERLLIV